MVDITDKSIVIEITANNLREILSSEEYSTVPIVTESFTYEDKKKIALYENVNNFGSDIACLFEDLYVELERIPTQQEYIDKGIIVTEKWWINELCRKDSMLRGLQFEGCILQAVKNRLGRGYLSRISELYAIALLKEIYPDAKIITHDVIDFILGVDIVMEYKGKRLYFHVYKNSYWADIAFKNKEYRGGMQTSTGQFVKYRRNFTGDISLIYDTIESDTTEIINGIPLFREKYIRTTVDRAMKNSAVGERVGCMNSKLNKLNNWLFKHFGTFVNF